MSDNSTLLSLPYMMPSQAQKHVTHNEALRLLDVVVQLAVKNRGRTTPPTVAEDGDRFIVAPGATLEWAGQSGKIAVWDSVGGWEFLTPRAGWTAHVIPEELLIGFNGTEWVEIGGSTGPLQNIDLLGVNSTADLDNRLSVSSHATLLTHAGMGHQLKMNKAGVSDTVSLLFQTNWNGRAEMGTMGDDAFSIKVSADGGTWTTALRANEAGTSIDNALTLGDIVTLKSYAKAALPAAGTAGAGAVAYVSDAAGGAQPAYCDGTAWLQFSDNQPV